MCTRALVKAFQNFNCVCACVGPSRYRAAQTRSAMRTCVGLPGGTYYGNAVGRWCHIVETWGLAACCRLRLCRVRGPGPVSFAPANVPPKGGWLLFCVGPSSPTGGRLPRNPVPKASQTAGCQCCACIGGAGRVLRGGSCPEEVRGAVLCGTAGPSMQPKWRAPSREPVPKAL